MNWFLIAISGYFLNAVVGIIDKFLLGQRPTTKPPVYTFYIGLLSLFALVLAPFGLAWPGGGQFLIALLAGALLLLGLLNLFQALDINEASRIFPAVGGLTPILVLILSAIFLAERLSGGQILAFFLLVLGGVLVSIEKIGQGKMIKGVHFLVLTVLFSATSLILTKYVFIHQGFISGFIWTRIGCCLTALLFLVPSELRYSILNAGRQAKSGLSLLLVSNKALAGAASLLVNLAIARASVSLVKALEGSQYTFLLILTSLLSWKLPQILAEKMSREVIVQKILAILLIGAGLIILAV